jgi:hypothetical protein
MGYKLRMFCSFSGLLTLLKSGTFELKDNPNTIYAFSCSKQGIKETVKNVEFQEYEKLFHILNGAEQEGRVIWGLNNITPEAKSWILNHFFARNITIKQQEQFRQLNWWNHGLLKEIFAENPEIELVFYKKEV